MDPTERKALAARYPNIPATLAELAHLESLLALPLPTVHVVSDVHGEHVKLRHVFANASGSLRPLVTALLGERLDPQARLRHDPAERLQPRASWGRGSCGGRLRCRDPRSWCCDLRRWLRPCALAASASSDQHGQ